MPPRKFIIDQDAPNILEAVVESSLLGYWDWHIPQNTHYLSPRLKGIIGYSEHDEIECPEDLNQLIFPEDLEQVNLNFKAHIETHGKTPFRNIIRLKHKEGSTVWVLSSGSVIEWSETGKPIRMVGTYLDITAQKEKEHLIAQHQQRLETIYEASHTAIWDRDVSTGDVFWSDRFYQIIGYSRDEIEPSTENFLKLVHPDDRAQTIRNLRSHLVNPVPYYAKYRLRHKSGEYRWAESVGKAVRDAEGNVIRIIGSCMDIHEDHQRKINLENSLFQLNETARIAACGGWELDLKTQKTTWSDVVKRIHEVDDDFESNLENGIQFYDKESIPPLKEALENCIEHREPFDLVLKMISAKKRAKWVRVRGHAVIDADDQVTKLRGMLQDITKPHEQKIQLESALALTSQQNQRLREFAYIVSHNLRSHTGNLTTLSQLLEEEVDTVEHHRIQGMIKETSETLHRTIEELTQIIRIQTETNRKKSLCSLVKLLESTKATFAQSIKANEVTITDNFNPSDTLLFDPEYLESIFRNLIGNAIKYRHPERAPIIKLHLSSNEQFHTIEFQDNGLGINLNRSQEKIFNLYQTFHGNPDAHGVGLYLVRSQLEALGARINVTSTPGEGSTFTLIFPLT